MRRDGGEARDQQQINDLIAKCYSCAVVVRISGVGHLVERKRGCDKTVRELVVRRPRNCTASLPEALSNGAGALEVPRPYKMAVTIPTELLIVITGLARRGNGATPLIALAGCLR